ncbi:MAG: C-terminal binding protein [Dehalococcoidia bacterium]
MANHLVCISPAHMDPSYAIERKGLGPDVDLHVFSAVDPDTIGREAREADAIMTWRMRIEAPAIEQLERCKLIIRMGVGFDVVDTEAAKSRGIPVCNVPDYCTNEVADHALGLLLTLARGIVTFNDGLRSGDEAWSWAAAGPLSRITGKTLGIIGLGRIGTAVALRAKAFGMRVAFFDPYVSDGMERALGLTRLPLDDLLAESDYLSLHTPLTSETRGMVNAAFLARVKTGVTIINTSRGPVVDVDSLEAAMREGRVGAAALDVLPQEPPVPAPGLLQAWRANEEWLRGRLVLTPHAAFYSGESDHDMRVKATQTVRDVLDGMPFRNRVNP